MKALQIILILVIVLMIAFDLWRRSRMKGGDQPDVKKRLKIDVHIDSPSIDELNERCHKCQRRDKFPDATCKDCIADYIRESTTFGGVEITEDYDSDYDY